MKLSKTRRPVSGMEKVGFAMEEAWGYSQDLCPAFRINGPIDIDLLKQSYLETLDLFPRLKKIVEVEGNRRKKRLYWRKVDGDFSETFETHQLSVEDDSPEAGEEAFTKVQEELLNVPGSDMTKVIGVRIHLYSANPDLHYAVIRFSHILCDGRGILTFASFWFERYDRFNQDRESPLESESLPAPVEEKESTILTIIRKMGLKGLLLSIWMIFRSFWYSLRMPITYLTEYKHGLKGKFRILDTLYPQEKVKTLRARAKAMGLTINDFALMASYHAVLRFCRESGIEAKRLIINSPRDVREADSTTTKIYVVPRMIDLIPLKIKDDRHLAAAIKEELRRITVSRIDCLGFIGLSILGKLSYDRLVRMMKKSNKRGKTMMATLIISNLGEVSNLGFFERLGEASVTHFYHGARAQYPPGYATPLYSFKGRMVLGMGYYEPAMTKEKCRTFGKIFFEELDRLSRVDFADLQCGKAARDQGSGVRDQPPAGSTPYEIQPTSTRVEQKTR